MDNINLVTTALEQYDVNSMKYKKLFKDVKYIAYIDSLSELSHNSIVFYNKDGNFLFRSRYEVIGVYEPTISTWTWAWAIPTLKQNSINIVKKLWMYGVDLNNDSNGQYLKLELITSKFHITDYTQLEIHLAIASYLSKIPLIFEYIVSSAKTHFIKDETITFDFDSELENYIISENNEDGKKIFRNDDDNPKKDNDNTVKNEVKNIIPIITNDKKTYKDDDIVYFLFLLDFESIINNEK